MIKNLLLLLLIIISESLIGQNPTFPPVPDWEKDSTLVTFVNHLKGAVANKDVKYVTSLLDKEVMSAFDGGNDVKSFLENWQLMDDSTQFWPLLSRVLQIGGAYVNDPEDETGRYQVVFPYVYNYEPALEDDPYALGCIVGKKVNLREQPDTKAAVKTQLTYDVIQFLYEEETSTSGKNELGSAEWFLVETYDKKFRGWVNWKFVYPVNGPRLFLFQNPAGKWRISAFVAGD